MSRVRGNPLARFEGAPAQQSPGLPDVRHEVAHNE